MVSGFAPEVYIYIRYICCISGALDNEASGFSPASFTEQLSCGATAETKKDWERDYDKLIGPLLEKDVPCYILYRLDAKIPLGYSWLLISWIPDTASIRQKMVYASENNEIIGMSMPRGWYGAVDGVVCGWWSDSWHDTINFCCWRVFTTALLKC